jgi:replicative DNA helicase
MAEELELPAELLLELFRLSLHDNYICQIVTTKIKGNWLQDEVERDFHTELKYQSETLNTKPTFGTMMLAARTATNKELFEYVQLIKETKLGEANTLIKSVEDFIKRAMFISLYDSSGELFNKNQKKKAYNVFIKGAEDLSKFSLSQDLVEPVFANFPVRNANRIIEASKGRDLMPCGIDGIDAITGGWQRKEYILFLSGSKGTKSYCMTHMGINYARRGIGVIHVQLEGTRKQVLDRYDAAWLGSSYTDVRAGIIEEAKFKSYRKIVDNIGKGEIFVHAPERYNSMNMLDVRQLVIDIKKKRDIGVVIIDYLDLCPPDSDKYSVNDERMKKQRSSRAMKDLAMDTDTLVISNTQSNSVNFELMNDPDFVLRRENLSEDRGTVQAVDGLITINRTKEERANGTARLFVDAFRDYQSDQVIQIHQNLRRARFYDRKATINADMWQVE